MHARLLIADKDSLTGVGELTPEHVKGRIYVLKEISYVYLIIPLNSSTGMCGCVCGCVWVCVCSLNIVDYIKKKNNRRDESGCSLREMSARSHGCEAVQNRF